MITEEKLGIQPPHFHQLVFSAFSVFCVALNSKNYCFGFKYY